MNRISELKRILSQNFGWNKSRIDCFARMLLSLFAVRTVNLSELALGMASKAEVKSRYKRLQRFFRYFQIDYEVLAIWIFKLFVNKEQVYLAIDRTNWFFGKVKINILTLGIAHEGIAIPVIWTLLDKAGNAKASEHKDIVKRFIKLFGKSCIAGVLADREFGNGEFFKWLNEEEIPFFIRIKDNALVLIKGRKFKLAKRLFYYLNPKQKTTFGMTVEIFGQTVYLAGSRSEGGELMVVATNQRIKNAIEIYLRRWEIETLFLCLKSRGFYFESTQLKHLDRIEKMMALLTVGLCWAHKIGEWQADIKPIRFSRHKNIIRPQNSFFRYGLDLIREIILNPFKTRIKLEKYFRFLSPIKPVLEVNI